MTQPLSEIVAELRRLWCSGSCRTCDCTGNADCPVVTDHKFEDMRWVCVDCGTRNRTAL